MKKTKLIIVFQIITVLLISSYSCKKDDTPKAIPTVTTMGIINQSLTSIKSGGIVTDNGGSDITSCGLCWSSNKNPTIEDSITTETLADGRYTSTVKNLYPYSVYYVRAYATNNEGTGYGSSIPIFDLDSIYAGFYDNSFIYHEFASPITLHPILDNNMLIIKAIDTINLQFGNDSFSLLIFMKIANPDSLNAIYQTDTIINCELVINSNDSACFHISQQSYAVGLGRDVIFRFITAFLQNDVIRDNSKWTYFNNYPLPNGTSMWEYPINAPFLPYAYDGGPWYVSGSDIRYIGMKYKGRLGWIKVDIHERTNPKFISYAVKK
jgi:hypothetical protein